jgi:D-alanyl-D-alanine carboxypeptidase
VKTKKYTCLIQNNGQARESVWENTNKLLERPECEGIKTGITQSAGPCLACYFKKDEH